jgi:hypothetical protein
MMKTLAAATLVLAATLFAGPLQTASAQGGTEVPGAVTRETLPQMLTNLGYEPKTLGDGATCITMKTAEFTLFVRVSLSSDGRKVWLASNCGAVNPERVAPARLRNLLARDTGTARFYLCDCDACLKKTEKDLYVSQPVDNRSLTAQALRAELDDFAGSVVRTAPLWQVCLVAPTAEAAAK